MGFFRHKKLDSISSIENKLVYLEFLLTQFDTAFKGAVEYHFESHHDEIYDRPEWYIVVNTMGASLPLGTHSSLEFTLRDFMDYIRVLRGKLSRNKPRDYVPLEYR